MTYRQMYSEGDYANPMTLRLEFAIPTAGATTPALATINGIGASILRTGVGTYTLTLNPGIPGRVVMYADANLRLSALGNTFAQVLSYNATTRVLTVQCVTGTGTAAEWPAVNANNVLHVMVVFSDSSTAPSRG